MVDADGWDSGALILPIAHTHTHTHTHTQKHTRRPLSFRFKRFWNKTHFHTLICLFVYLQFPPVDIHEHRGIQAFFFLIRNTTCKI